MRPFSAISHIWKSGPVTAWGGAGKGKVTDLPASEWMSYMRTPDHPEYPSGSASACAAHATVLRKYFGTDDIGWKLPFPAGSSSV